ncbi:MAG: hypothetical protein R3B96_23145 [Pirellulaceae bacterium]
MALVPVSTAVELRFPNAYRIGPCGRSLSIYVGSDLVDHQRPR